MFSIKKKFSWKKKVIAAIRVKSLVLDALFKLQHTQITHIVHFCKWHNKTCQEFNGINFYSLTVSEYHTVFGILNNSQYINATCVKFSKEIIENLC